MMPKVGFSKKVTTVLFLFFSIWAFLVVIAPIMIPSESITDLSGLTFISDNEKDIKELAFPWNVVYTAGDRLCHQHASRSFFINGNQMPFCSRCTAIWIGIPLGLLLILFINIPLDFKIVVLFLLGLVPIGIDGVGQLFQLWESTNLIRVATGLLTGIICGIGLGIIINEISDIISSKKSKSN